MPKKAFFISTAIDYPSAPPHLGHLYEKVCADAIARWKQLNNFNVHFSTGTDEHGQKIERKAEENNLTPKKFADKMSKSFIKLCKTYSISHNDFIRTTEPRHKTAVEHFMKKIRRDIYKGTYEGSYCTDCETFYQEKDLDNGNCKIHKKPTEYLKEEAYFFRMSKYQNQLMENLKNNPILPEHKKNEILERLKEPLKDLCISRTSIKWGIPLPFDKKHTVYIWGDALTNYLTTIGYPKSSYKTFWPADIHIIGKDIIWHHYVIWHSLLMSARLKTPKLIFVHGFINIEGEKMSKSRGTVIDPAKLAEKYPIDSIRYYLIRETPFGDDGDFSEHALTARHNGELANELGNLLNRIIILTEKKLNSTIKKDKSDSEIFKSLNIKKISGHMDSYELHKALEEIFKFVQECNRYANGKEPWKLEDKAQINNTIYNLADSMRIISILLSPFMPQASEKINSQLNVKAGKIKDCRHGLLKTTKIKKGEILFPRIQ